MLIANLLEEMLGDSNEFEQFHLMLPVDTATDVRDLANKIGVPATRLMAELVKAGISEAQYEWRRITIERPECPQVSLKSPWDGGPIP